MSGNQYNTITVASVLITPSQNSVSFQVAANLSYVPGIPVFVSGIQTFTNNFLGSVLFYQAASGDMTIGNISSTNGVFTVPDYYQVCVFYSGPTGSTGPTGPIGSAGLSTPGPTGPVVPFSGGNPMLIIFTAYDTGFDCGGID
jgi:hypothetical protein